MFSCLWGDLCWGNLQGMEGLATVKLATWSSPSKGFLKSVQSGKDGKGRDSKKEKVGTDRDSKKAKTRALKHLLRTRFQEDKIMQEPFMSFSFLSIPPRPTTLFDEIRSFLFN